jgi:site-specific DNA-methyltransferase (adenine-specific)
LLKNNMSHTSPSIVVFGDNLKALAQIATSHIDLIYIDPPFNTGKTQSRTRIRTVSSENGNRIGFQGKGYATEKLGTTAYSDSFEDYLDFMEPRLREAHRVLAPSGLLYVHLDYHEVHYVKVLLDQIFGRDCFQNEIIWAYDYGAKPKTKWPPKHDNILVYSKDPKSFTFNVEDIDRIPYMAPGLVSKEKAEKGKLPTDVWWHSIVGTNSKERTGYATQKPLGILKRIIAASSRPGDTVLDFFAGSGTTGDAALQLGRQFVLVDNNPEAIEMMKKRFSSYEGIEYVDLNRTD